MAHSMRLLCQWTMWPGQGSKLGGLGKTVTNAYTQVSAITPGSGVTH